MNRSKIIVLWLVLVFISCTVDVKHELRWNQKYNFIADIPPVIFHYDHGILTGSYTPGKETTEVRFNDVSNYLGHVCLCGAGGYRISQIAVNSLADDGQFPEKGEFTLISSRDHTISDVIALILGCSRRNDPEKNQYFIDETIKSVKREYHYYIGYHPQKKAVHIIYRKHLLIGNEQMDRLWKVELAYDQNPAEVNSADFKLYQDTMIDMIKEVLTGQKQGLFEAEPVNYDEFVSRVKQLKADNFPAH